MNATKHELMIIYRNLVTLQVIAMQGGILTKSGKMELDEIIAKIEERLVSVLTNI